MLQHLFGLKFTRPPPKWQTAAHCARLGLRFLRHQAFDDAFDADELSEARKWRQSFQPSSIPKGQTIFSRSSGPGGQHVNKYGFLSVWNHVRGNRD
jgi:peptidyl-tRNA hydrolase ICT1